MSGEAERYLCPRCKTEVRGHHVSIACDICDEWHHVVCVGIQAAHLDSISHFMCRQCRYEGFLGSSAEESSWFVESMDAPPAPPPPQEETSEDDDESSGDDEPSETGIRFGKVEYGDGSEFWGELHDGDEYIGELVAKGGRSSKFVKMISHKLCRIIWEDIEYAVAQVARNRAREVEGLEGAVDRAPDNEDGKELLDSASDDEQEKEGYTITAADHRGHRGDHIIQGAARERMSGTGQGGQAKARTVTRAP
jgi:hypothetical protein